MPYLALLLAQLSFGFFTKIPFFAKSLTDMLQNYFSIYLETYRAF